MICTSREEQKICASFVWKRPVKMFEKCKDKRKTSPRGISFNEEKWVQLAQGRIS